MNNPPERSLPSGTVTFLFTDIEGSTELLKRLREQYGDLLKAQRSILREIFDRWEGREVDTQGDSFFISFPRATKAVAAAVEVQRALAAYDWPGEEQVRVRMGLHTGEPLAQEEGYVGMDVHRAARIGSSGHGGQVLLSNTTAELVRHVLPDGTFLKDLGAHQLKDMPGPENLWQLSIQDLRFSFPPLKTKSLEGQPPAPHNLPEQSTPFFGRVKELEELKGLLVNPDGRLITILGPGGMGKTRIAIEVGKQVLPQFPDGVYFINLAVIEDDEQIIYALGEGLHFLFFPGSDPNHQILEFLRERQVLLIFDNFEHVIGGAGLLTEILEVCPSIHILVTSRETLRLSGEWIIGLEGLRYPATSSIEEDTNGVGIPGPDGEFSALTLLEERIRRANPSSLSAPNVRRELAIICDLVQGMPLALELAGAWSDVLSVPEIAKEIEKDLDFLSQDLRSGTGRHASIHTVFRHSWNLLQDDEREVFKRLSLFRNGFTREAAEQVASATIRDLQVLRAKSLIRLDVTGRYQIHELMRQYAELELRDNLEDARETEENFVHYFADFLELHAVDLAEGDWKLALQEIENFQKAWNLAVSFDDHYSLKMMSMGLWFAFEYSGRYDLCLSIFEKGVDQLRTGVLGDGRALALGLLLIPYGFQMIVVKDVQAGWKAMNEGLQLLKKMGSEIELGIAVIFMAATGVLSIDDGIKRLEDALKVFRQGQGLWMEGEAQAQYGLYLLRAGRLDEARDQFKRCIELGEKKSYRRVLAMGFNGLAEYYSERGDVHAAIEYCSKALTAFQDCRLINAQARLHLELGQYYSQTDELLLAKQNLTKALELLKGSGFTERIAFCHLGLGNLAYKSGDLPEARRAYHQVLTYGLELNHEELLMGSLMEMAVVYSGGSEKTLAFVLTQVILATAFDWRQVKARAGKMAERLECELPEETVAALKAEASAKDILVLGREVLELLNNDVSVN